MLVSATCAVRAAAHRCALRQGMRLTGRQEVMGRAHHGGERGRPPGTRPRHGSLALPVVRGAACRRTPGSTTWRTWGWPARHPRTGSSRAAPTPPTGTGRFDVQEPAQRCLNSGAAQGQPQHDSAQWQMAPAVPSHERGGEHAPTRGQGSQCAAACLFMGSPAITPSHGPPSGDDGRVAFSHKGTPEQAGVGCFTGPWRAALRERWAHATGCP